MPQQIHEAIKTLEATPVEGKPGRLKITLISPGQGSSGIYSQECLESAATDRVFAAGTHMFLDHPSESEKLDRPERSVKDLGAVLAEDAYWDEAAGALVAEADTFSQHRELLTEMQAHIGVSIRAAAEVGEGSGRSRQITRLVEAQSVDFVTKAGRGGSFTVLESARPSLVNKRALRHDDVAEATVNDQREALDDVLKATHGSEKVWVWLRDFDATTAWFEISTDGTEATYSQTYETGDNGLATAMTGERIEVRQVTQYVPVDSAGQSNTQESKEDTMPQIEEARLRQLEEDAGRVTALESERDNEKARADKAEAILAESTRSTRMDVLIAESDHAFTALEIRGLKADAKVDESGKLDEDAFKTAVSEAAAEAAEAAGAGKPRGNGARPRTTDNEVSESDLDELDDAIFGAVKEG